MSQYSWSDPASRPLLGKSISRVDGPSKASGRAKYTYDYNPQGLLAGKILRCPYAHAKITSIDTSAAEKMPGVKSVVIIQKPGTEIFWAGDEIVGVAAVDEGTVEDALRAIKVEYEVLPHFVSDAEPPKNVGTDNGPLSNDESGSAEAALLRVVRHECLHHRAQRIAFGEGFDGDDLRALGVNRQHGTGIHRLAVQEYGAGAASAAIADSLGASEIETLA